DYHDQELDKLYIDRDRMYSHNAIRINYTTYDVLRQQEVLNPKTSKRFIRLPTEYMQDSGPSHPFLYAKILDIYHANV
ncbi:hypothetical protein BDV93DRAFT_412034, partial [Ceratobasidium sp. AG-I]